MKMITRIYTTTTTFYRRELPIDLASFTSSRGKSLFRNALLSGNAEIYFSLSGNFTMQSEPAFCGLGSLSMVLNALSVDPGKRWKGVWRWYSDEMIECCTPLQVIKSKGMTFQQFVATARGNGLIVIPKYAHQTTFSEFISDLETVTKSNDTHMVVSFSRQSLNQTGDGHFSPIGAFCKTENQVLVMDTARFKYPSYFVDATKLYNAMFPMDKETNVPRGYVLLSKGSTKPLPLCKITIEKMQWNDLLNLFWNEIPKKTKNGNLTTLISKIIPHKYHFFTSITTKG
jgi:glutathione gamma-glutamylcysteinyltransferase